MKVLKFLGITTLVCSLFVSCIDDSYNLDNFSSDTEINTALVGPIGESKITIEDLLILMNVDSTYINKKPEDGLLYFSYDTVSQINIKPLKIDVNGFTKIFDGDDDPDLQDLQQKGQMTFTENVDFGVNQDPAKERIDSVLVRNTNLNLKIFSTNPDLFNSNSVKVEIKLPNQLRLADGRKTIQLTGKEMSVSLDNAMLDFTKSTGLAFEYKISLLPGASFKLNLNTYLDFSCSLSDNQLRYKKIWGVGDFDPQVENESFGVDLFEKLADQDVKLIFADPQLYVRGISNIGVPTSFHIDQVTAKNTKNNQKEVAKFAETQGPGKEIPFSRTKKEGVESVSFDEFYSNDTIVNLNNMMGISPDSLNMQYTIKVGKKPEKGSFFITDNAYIDFRWGVEIPAWFKGGTYVNLKDTVAVDLGRTFENDVDLDRASLSFDLENGLPFNVDVELQFMTEDENGNIQLITNPGMKKSLIVETAKIGADNIVTTSTKKRDELKLDKTMQDDLKQIKYLQVYYKVKIPETVISAKITVKDFLKVKIGAYVKGKIKIN